MTGPEPLSGEVSTLYLPLGFYAFRRATVTVDAEWTRDLSSWAPH